MTRSALASLIDHTNLRPEATAADIQRLCDEARREGFAAVCVLPTRVQEAARHLQGSGVAVCTVIGFPLGAHPTEIKIAETRCVIELGATEIDVVVNLGALKDGNWTAVEQDLRGVVDAAAAHRIPVKVILETALLTDTEKARAAALAVACGAAFVKTSTGFAPQGGATVEDVCLLRAAVGPHIGVKASGGVRSLALAEAMVQAGANRLGTSAGIALLAELSPFTKPRC